MYVMYVNDFTYVFCFSFIQHIFSSCRAIHYIHSNTLNISFRHFRQTSLCCAQRKKVSNHAFRVGSRQSIRKEQSTAFGQFSGRSQRENRQACTSQSAKCIESVLSWNSTDEISGQVRTTGR